MLLPFSSVSHCASKLEKEEILSGSLGKAPVCPILACCFLQRWSLGLQRKLHHFPGSSLNLMLGCSNPRKCWSTHLLLILQRLGCCRWCSLHWMGWVSCLQSAWPFSFLLYELMLALDLCREGLGLFCYFNGSLPGVFCVVQSNMACTV